jgi:hypothetical protein
VSIEAAVERYETLLRGHRSDAYRAYLQALTLPDLAEHVARGRGGMHGLAGGGVTELVASLPRIAGPLRIDLRGLSAAERSSLLRELAEVQLRVDREDLAFARELLDRRRREDVSARADEAIAALAGEPDL